MPHNALADRNFRIYWFGSVIVTHGVWVYRVTLGWLAWELSHSSLWVGIIAFATFFPSTIFAPIGGVMADRYSLRAAAYLTHGAIMLLAVALALVLGFGRITIELLTLFAFLHGMASGAYTPIRLALIPRVVPREQLASAMGLTALGFNIARFFGPALAGVAINFYGAAWAIGSYALCITPAIIALTIIDLEPRGVPKPPSHLLADFKDGIAYTMNHADLRLLFGIVALNSVLTRGLLELLPAITDLLFGRGSGAFAALTSAVGGGAIASALVLTQARPVPTLTRFAASGAVVSSLLVLLFSTVAEFRLALGIAALLGCTATLCGIAAQTLLQLRVADDYRGRVMGFWSVFAMGGSALGGLVLGALAHFFSLRPVMIGCGALSILLALVIGRRLLRMIGDERA